ncbi:immunoglobulin-like domain-containing protein [Anaerorhabdus sp.]|uniref:immunoglobulin-like domain-containing protein n=1 Tax=Anaerorhabdus sp. TaxID=1872524 RepID=UPI002FC7BE09
MKKYIILFLCLFVVTACINKQSTSSIPEDISPPWINVENYIFETEVGNPINYETAIAYDETDGPCDVDVEGRVNFNIAGEYYLRYVAQDMSGNESSEPFTVIVHESSTKETVNPDDTNAEINKTCVQKNAVDKNQPCEMMVTNITDYEVIFQEPSGYDRCVAYGDELVDTEQIKNYSCNKLLRNDSGLWGYGIDVIEK